MTHGAHDPAGAAGGGRPLLPASAGVSNGVKALIVAGVLVSIMQGLFVGFASPFGRVWPAADSAKIDLPPSHF